MSDLQNNEHNYCLSEIHLQNFRCFEDFRMTLHPRLNVLVGANASGKTALLEALRISIGIVPKRILYNTNGTAENKYEREDYSNLFIKEEDVKIIYKNRNTEKTKKQVSITVSLHWNSNDAIKQLEQQVKNNPKLMIKNIISYKIYKQNNSSDVVSGNDYTDQAREVVANTITYSLVDKEKYIPLFSYYPTNRLYREDLPDFAIPINGSRLNGYMYWDSATLITAKSFGEWVLKHELALFQGARRGDNSEKVAPEYLVVREALLQCIDELIDFYYDTRSEKVHYVFKSGLSLPFDYWSDGVRNYITLVADIALRCAILNPDMGIHANETPGIVLIDEIDLHLHPSWQRTVIPNLRKAFPNIQFIITTHSPQVISSVPKESLFILKDYQVLTNQAFTEGRDTNQLLYDVFGVEVRPAEFREKLSHFYALLDAENPGEAQQQLAELEALWGSMDHEIVRAKLYLQDLLDEVVA